MLVLVLGGASLFLGRLLPPTPYLSNVLVALLLGALVLNTPLRRAIRLAPPGEEREPDPYAVGLRFTGKWVLRLGIILMGLQVQTRLFGRAEIFVILGVVAAALPAAFFISHALGALVGMRRPMADLVAGGTMICGASAVNAIAPVVGARRDEQGIAIAVTFLFSVFALVTYRPIAMAMGLSPAMAGLWGGLAVNDLASAVAVGNQMGGVGGIMAAASKSARVILLGPALIAFSLGRKEHAGISGKNILDQFPRFVLGYIGLALLRALGDHLLAQTSAWSVLISYDKHVVELTMTMVAASIGLHLGIRTLLDAGAKAFVVGGGASLFMATHTLGMIVFVSQGASAQAVLVGLGGVGISYLAYLVSHRGASELARLRARTNAGAPLSLREATLVLDAAERDGSLSDTLLVGLLGQLHPSIGELIPVRESPLGHGEGCRWITYWEGRSGWALVAICRDPGSTTPIHAHPHRLLGKTIEGVLEEIRFDETTPGMLRVSDRAVVGHNHIVTTDGLATLHVIRVAGKGPAIDLQFRGPEQGSPGRRMKPRDPIDVVRLQPGMELHVIEEIDDRPGHGGEGAGVGRPKVA